MDKETVLRIQIAKRLFDGARISMQSAGDPFEAARAVLNTHDATELILLVAAAHLSGPIEKKSRHTLFDYLDSIDAGTKKITAAHRSAIKDLNSIRNNLKHQGILPATDSVSGLVSKCQLTSDQICKLAFKKHLSDISLSSLIADEELRLLIRQAEVHHQKKEYESAIRKSGEALYELIEVQHGLLSWEFGGFKSLISPDSIRSSHDSFLLLHGIPCHQYRQFKDLAPNFIEGEIREHRWSKEYGHKFNWTEQNSLFCLNFAVDSLLTYQQSIQPRYRIIPYTEIQIDRIEVLTDTKLFNYPPAIPPKLAIALDAHRPCLVSERSKGTVLYGLADNAPESADLMRLTIYGPGFDSDPGPWYVSKSDVKITELSSAEFAKIRNAEAAEVFSKINP